MTPPSIYYSLNLVNLLQLHFQWLFFRISKSYFSSELPFEIGSCLCEKRGGVWVKKKEFFRVLFCDLEGLLQQFVAASETRGKLCIGTQVR